MMRRKVNDKEDKDQSASDSRHDSEETYSGHENASGIREEWTDDSIKPDEPSLDKMDLKQDGLEEDDQHV